MHEATDVSALQAAIHTARDRGDAAAVQVFAGMLTEVLSEEAEEAPDFTSPALQMAGLVGLEAVQLELLAAADAIAPDEGEPSPAAFRAAVARAAVLLAELGRWAGAVG